jgi:hypothetical protein
MLSHTAETTLIIQGTKIFDITTHLLTVAGLTPGGSIGKYTPNAPKRYVKHSCGLSPTQLTTTLLFSILNIKQSIYNI